MSKRAKAALAGGIGVIALSISALISPWEGRSLVAYPDIVKVWTICDGETQGVKPGMTATNAQCDAMLLRRVENDFYKPLTSCIVGFKAAPVSWQAAAVSLSYNVGVRAACSSTAAQLARQGRFKESCSAMTRFNRAGGRVVPGLQRRRENGDANRIGEYELCVEGL